MERLFPWLATVLGGLAMGAEVASTLFPTGLPGRDWQQFPAAGFSGPVAGIVYRLQHTVTNGMALGGVDTGCIDLETHGTWGYCTLFNTHVPRRGPLGSPLLGLHAGDRTWVLAAPRPSPTPALKAVPAWLPPPAVAGQPDLGPAQPAWAVAADNVPGWCRSVGGSAYDFPAGRAGCHGPAVVIWTSPVSGTLRVSGGLWPLRDLGRTMPWEVLHNEVAVAKGTLASGPTSARPQPLAPDVGGLRLEVEEGDTLTLSLAQGSPCSDYVGVDFALSSEADGRRWDLAADFSATANPNGPWQYDSATRVAALLAGPRRAVATASQIHYFGHYPVADIEFETAAPVRVGLRAWSPFLPGDLVRSLLPGIVFEAHLRNPTEATQTGTLALSFPGPLPEEAGAQEFDRREVGEGVRGLAVRGPKASYVLAVLGDDQARFGAGLGRSARAWEAIGKALPAAGADHAGASAAVDFTLAPGAAQVVRFALTWCAPTWKGGGFNASPAGGTFTHMYARHYPDAVATARLLAREHADLLRHVLAWQQVVYDDAALPLWLRDALVNVLYMITEDGYWAQKGPELPAWVREGDGLFGMNECPRGCPQIECIPCSFYGSLPLAYFFPELQLSTLRGYQGYQLPDGAPPWIFGGCTGQTPPIDFASPTRGYQFASNGISLAAIADRFLLCRDTPDGRYARELYPMLKRSLVHTVSLRTTSSYTLGERIIAMPDGNQGTEWFEAPLPGWAGMTAHIGGLHLAELRITERLARQVGDAEFARQCADWTAAALEAMEARLWDRRGFYLNYLEPESGRRSELVFGYQLDGEWVLAHHGLPKALPEGRIQTVLETIRRCNVAVTRYGAVNYANPDASVANPGGYGAFSYFPPELLMLAMTYMYYGQKDFGIELARKAWHNLICQQGYTWDMPNILRGDVDTGERTFGNDYYQDMMLWSLPAALAGTDVNGPCRPGGLVDRVLAAATR